jgi:hypothetical protein
MMTEIQKGVLVALRTGRLADAGKLRPQQISLGTLNNVREAIAICRQARTILEGVTAASWTTRPWGTPTIWKAYEPSLRRHRRSPHPDHGPSADRHPRIYGDYAITCRRSLEPTTDVIGIGTAESNIPWRK